MELARTASRTERRRAQLTGQRIGGTAAVILACTAVISCSPSDPTDDDVSAVGENGSVGGVDLLSISLVASAEGEPGRFLGTMENESDQAVEVTLSDDDEDVVIDVPAGDEFRFEDNETLLDTVGDAPGANAVITATTDAGSAELLVPVLDGTLEQYRPYLPE